MSEIGNEVCKVPNGIELNEKDYCTCLLSTLKDMEKNYVIAMTEASNEWLYHLYYSSFLKISTLQRKVYLEMFQKGWYQLEAQEDRKISEKYKLLEKDYKGLSD